MYGLALLFRVDCDKVSFYQNRSGGLLTNFGFAFFAGRCSYFLSFADVMAWVKLSTFGRFLFNYPIAYNTVLPSVTVCCGFDSRWWLI